MKNRRQKTEKHDSVDIPNREDKDSNSEKRHRETLLKMLMLLTGPFLYLFGFLHILKGDSTEGLLDITGGAVVTIGYFFLKKNRGALVTSRFLIVAIGALLLYLLTIQTEMPYRALWSYLYPLLAFFLFGKREGMIWMSLFFLMSVSFLSFPDFFHMRSVENPDFKLRFLVSLGLVSIMAFLFEVTREKAQGKMLINQKLLKESESRYRDAYERLMETQSQLVQSAKLASIGELASGVAHELNQPLMVIRGTAQLIRRSVQKNNLNHDELMEQLDPVEKNTKRMMNIINHLRTFSRQSKETFNPLDMNKVVKVSFTLINEQLRLHNIEVIEAYASGLPPVQGNETQLEQVMINLIANARDAMDREVTESGGDDKKKKILRISTSKAEDGSHLEIRVADSGQGIPPGDLDRIFDPFFTTKDVGKGTGLGLSISYGIIKDHGGEIKVMKTGPEGTTIGISLPVCPKNPPCITRPLLES